MTQFSRWHQAFGEDLAEAVVAGNAPDAIVDCEAIYLWKRTLRAPEHALDNAQSFVDWCSHAVLTPIGHVEDRQISHFAWLNKLQLRGAPLSQDKLDSLLVMAKRPDGRRWLARLIAGMSVHSPALYVGETNRLSSRVAEHIQGDTNFGSTIAQSPGIQWSDLVLRPFDPNLRSGV